jgi:6-pyruvoyltetrahydropterin/6-carboxytetrahydropterin synthase
MQSVTTEFHFSAAHRLEGHPKCGRMHGHNYRVVITVASPKVGLDAMGFIIDFGMLKKVVNPIIDNLDHKYMVSETNLDAKCPYFAVGEERGDTVVLPIKQTSAECLSELLSELIQIALYDQGFAHVAVAEVQVWETPKAFGTS